jgi:ATP-dependent Zn protease
MLMLRNLRLFFILFLIHCPYILSDNKEKSIATQEEAITQRDTFESLMSISREHTQNIGFCIQQILQTLNSNKEQVKIFNKSKVIDTLIQLQELVELLIQDIYSKNTKNALSQGIILTNGIMNFLLKGLESNFKNFDLDKLMEQINKKCYLNISDESIISIYNSNTLIIKNLVYASDRMGLTWYNLVYRKFKDANGYSILKGGATIATTIFVACIILNNSQFIKANGGWFDKNIGTTPRQDQKGNWIFDVSIEKTLDEINNDIESLNSKSPLDTTDRKKINSLIDGQKLLKSNPNQKTAPIYEASDSAGTIFQSLSTSLKSLQSAGIITMGALCTVSFSGITDYLLGDWYQKTKHSSEQKLEDLDKILSGSKSNKEMNYDGQEKVYFKDLVGCEELEVLAKKIANFIKHPERYERAQIEEHRGILLYGPPQTGKSLFAKALRTLIQNTLGNDRKMSFIDGKKYLDYGYPLDVIFKEAEYLAPSILFFDEIDLIGTNREKDPKKTGQLLTCMQGIDISSKQIIVIGATNRIEQLDKALLVDGRFGKKIFIGYPDYAKRKTFIEKELEKRSIKLSAEFIDHIAQETDSCSYNNLRRIITEAIILSANETRPVCQNDFEKTLDTEVRKIDRGTRAYSTKEEKEIIATYQAGKAVARHILQTKHQVVKITIEDVARNIKSGQTGIVVTNSDSESSENEKLATNSTGKDSKIKLGEVFTKTNSNNNELISDEEMKKECLTLLAGSIAQQILLNSTYSKCNTHDRAEVMQMIYSMISQGEKIDDKVRSKALKIKEEYEEEIKKILVQHKDFLATVINQLIEKITIDRYDWAQIIAQ